MEGQNQGEAVAETPAATPQLVNGEAHEQPAAEGAEAAEPEKEKKEDPKMSARFAALSKREKAIVEQQRQIKAEREETERLQARLKPIIEAIAQRDSNPQALLDAAGINFEQLMRFHMNNGKPAPEDEISNLRKELEKRDKAFKDFQEQLNKRDAEAQKAFIEHEISRYKREVNTHVEENPDKYELILATESQNDVWSEIERHHAETGEIISPDKAAEIVEDRLTQQAEKWFGAKKFSERLVTKAEEKTPPKKKEEPAKSLSSKQTMSDPIKKSDFLDDKERLARAAQLLQYK